MAAGLSFNVPAPAPDGSAKYTFTERFCRTRRGELVREVECVDGGNLAFCVGDQIPLAEARTLGLIDEVEVAAAAVETPEVSADLGAERQQGTTRFGRRGK